MCHAALGASYTSIAALDKGWKRRVQALPNPNGLAPIYSRNELDQMVNDLETAATEMQAAGLAKAT